MRIMLTGARGNLGAEVIRRLRRLGCSVVAFLRSAGDIVCNDDTVIPVEPYQGQYPKSGCIGVIHGDARAPDLGLPQSVYQALQDQTEMVAHAAALTSFGKPWSWYESININGTQHILDFVRRKNQGGPISLVHVSTMYVCGERPGVFQEGELERDQSFGSPYEKSKYCAEKLLHAAMAEGIPIAIVRPSIIVGDSSAGKIRKFDTIYTVYRLTSAGLVRTIPGDYGATLDIVPIDWVADGIATVVERFERAIGKTLHLCSSAPLTLRDINDVCAEFPSFNVPRFVPGHIFKAYRMDGLEKRYYDDVVGLYESYFRRQVEFIRDSTKDVFPDDPPRANKDLLRISFQYAQDVGYFKRRAGTI